MTRAWVPKFLHPFKMQKARIYCMEVFASLPIGTSRRAREGRHRRSRSRQPCPLLPEKSIVQRLLRISHRIWLLAPLPPRLVFP